MNRFVVKFRNGTYHIFDTVYYGAAQARRTKKEADEAAARLNARHAQGGKRA